MEFSDHQRLFLTAVCKHFHETGTWPTYGMIDQQLRPYKDFDIEEIGKDLDRFMHDSDHAPISGLDLTRSIMMNVSALLRCQKEDIFPKLSEDLDAFMDVVRLCISRFETRQEELDITSAEVADLFGMIDNTLAKVFQLILVEGFHERQNPGNEPSVWSFRMRPSIRKYRHVTTIEQYVAVRSELIQQSRPPLSLTDFNWSGRQQSVLPFVSTNPFDNIDAATLSRRFGGVAPRTSMDATLPETSTNAVVPMELVEGTRGYIEKVARQVNRTYGAECYDACAVMLRRLIETLIIEAFEAHHIADHIKAPSGEFVQLGDLVDRALAESAWNLGRSVKKDLRQLKDIGNRSAHDRRYNATKSDIDKIASNVRGVVGELVVLRS